MCVSRSASIVVGSMTLVFEKTYAMTTGLVAGSTGGRGTPADAASRYHVACGSHCSPQRQSLSAPVTVWGRLNAMPSPLRPAVMPLTMPPGALLYSVDPKKRYGGLLRPVPCRRLASYGLRPRIQFS